MFFHRPKAKVFVIGRNKTGTTSITEVLANCGYRLGDQREAENLVEDWMRRDFRALIRYCKKSDAFQDVPFSMAYTYQAMDAAFPNSKFILTVRDNAEQWYRSLTRYHSKLLNVENCPPTLEQLKVFPYVEPGWMWRQQQIVYGATEETLYEPELYKNHYNQHTSDVNNYFRYRSKDLLTVNLSHESAAADLARFLGVAISDISIPHLNRSH